jgi:hypothetical protein
MMTRESQVAVARRDSEIDTDLETGRLAPVWDGILREFRNHLTVLLAAASEIRAAQPAVEPPDISAALAETEWNVERLNALVGFVDGALRDGTPVVADLDDVLARALRLAAPALGASSVTLHKERRTGITNRGSAVESLLAALFVELARADGNAVLPGASRGPRIDVYLEATRSALFLSIESTGRRPSGESWRLALASDLAARVGATVSPLPDSAGYLVRFA